MGVAKANATNAAQGWRGNRQRPIAEPQIEEPTMAHDKMNGGAMQHCGGGGWQKNNSGNSYRAKHDDGSRKSRRKSGGMSKKHHSPAHNPGY